MIYHGISHKSLALVGTSPYTHKPILTFTEVSVSTKNRQVTNGIFHSLPREKVVYLFDIIAIKSTVANTINLKHAQCMLGILDEIQPMKRLSCILIGCIFYEMF